VKLGRANDYVIGPVVRLGDSPASDERCFAVFDIGLHEGFIEFGISTLRGDERREPRTPDGKREINRPPRQLLVQNVGCERIQSETAQGDRYTCHVKAKLVGLFEHLTQWRPGRDGILRIGHPVECDRSGSHHFLREAMRARSQRLIFLGNV
jgi:hypothetical protein